jgi:broad specificity phosphatase PhoE
VTEILLVRHGETEWNRLHRWQGHTDTPLNDTGRAQARELAHTLAGERVDAVYSSDLSRASETAAAIAGEHGLAVLVDPDLREIDVGGREGLTREEVEQRFPDGGWNGETREEHAARVLRALHRIADRHPDGRVVVVGHGGTLRRAQEAALVEPLGPIGNCATWAVRLRNGTLLAVD